MTALTGWSRQKNERTVTALGGPDRPLRALNGPWRSLEAHWTALSEATALRHPGSGCGGGERVRPSTARTAVQGQGGRRKHSQWSHCFFFFNSRGGGVGGGGAACDATPHRGTFTPGRVRLDSDRESRCVPGSAGQIWEHLCSMVAGVQEGWADRSPAQARHKQLLVPLS